MYLQHIETTTGFFSWFSSKKSVANQNFTPNLTEHGVGIEIKLPHLIFCVVGWGVV